MSDNQEHTEAALDAEALRKLCDGATEGPWLAVIPDDDYDDYDDVRVIVDDNGFGERIVCNDIHQGFDYGTADAHFIAAARTALPAALDEIERLHRQIKALADSLAAFDCTEDAVPNEVDVPDDYERGVHDAAHRVRSLLPEKDQ